MVFLLCGCIKTHALWARKHALSLRNIVGNFFGAEGNSEFFSAAGTNKSVQTIVNTTSPFALYGETESFLLEASFSVCMVNVINVVVIFIFKLH